MPGSSRGKGKKSVKRLKQKILKFIPEFTPKEPLLVFKEDFFFFAKILSLTLRRTLRDTKRDILALLNFLARLILMEEEEEEDNNERS